MNSEFVFVYKNALVELAGVAYSTTKIDAYLQRHNIPVESNGTVDVSSLLVESHEPLALPVEL